METGTHLDNLRIIAGGQTGIDRAALDFCLDNQIRCGGWCPSGRKAEDGIIDPKYPLNELSTNSYSERTAANVEESEATVILFMNEMTGGTLKSFEFVRKYNKPFLLLDFSILDMARATIRLQKFLEKFNPAVVNFSGPRQSQWPDGYHTCYSLLQSLHTTV